MSHLGGLWLSLVRRSHASLSRRQVLLHQARCQSLSGNYRLRLIRPVSSASSSCQHVLSAPHHNLRESRYGYAATARIHTTCSRRGLETVKCPAFAESVSEGDVRWEKQVGDSVQEDELVCEIETDKTSVPVTAPHAGVITELLMPDGEKVTPGTPLFTLEVGVEGVVSEGQPAPPEPAQPSQPPPEVRAVAADDVSQPIPASPPAAPAPPSQPISTLSPSDVKVERYQGPPVVTGTPTRSSKDAPASIEGTRTETRVKMNRMRQRIAARLKEAQNTCAMLTTFNEIDMSNIIDMRKLFKEAFAKRHNVKLGFMSAFVKASAFALQDQPVVNAVIEDLEIVYRDYIDISVAVATPKGLVVPVLRNVQGLNYAELEKAMNELGERARTGALAIEDMDGGTFTISNGGVFGSMFGTPIINPPQSAILGMHAIIDKPVAINGKVEIRPMMYVALTYDHRLIDGREAVTFLRKIKSAIEDPRVLLLDL